MYIYKKTEPGIWTVGYYTEAGEWVAESDFNSPAEAVQRTLWLNGGKNSEDETDQPR